MDSTSIDRQAETYAEWVARRPERRAPEIDFGTTWTSATSPNTTWRISWNTGSCELVAVTATGDSAERLGWYATAADASRVLFDWGERALEPGGLDTMRRDIADWNQAEADYRQDMADYAQALKDEEAEPRWQEYIATCDRGVDVDGRVEWRPFIDLDYDEWDRISQHPQWQEYLAAAYALPDDVDVAPPFEQWLDTQTPSRDTPSADREPFPLTMPDGSKTELSAPAAERAGIEDLGPPLADQTPVEKEAATAVTPGGHERGAAAEEEVNPTGHASTRHSVEHRIVERWLTAAAAAGQVEDEANLRRWADISSQTPDQPRLGRRQPRRRPEPAGPQTAEHQVRAPDQTTGDQVERQLDLRHDPQPASQPERPGRDGLSGGDRSPDGAVRRWYRKSIGRGLG